MNPDVFVTIAFVLYAVVVAAGTGLLITRSERDTVVNQAVENRLNGSISTARPAAERAPPPREKLGRTPAS
jgi:hypothetical protein